MRGSFGNRIEQLVGHPVWVTRQKADAFQPGFLGDNRERCAANPPKSGPSGMSFAVAIHNLTEQRHFFDTLPCQTAHVRDDFADASAALDAAPIGDDARRCRRASSHRQSARAR